MPFLYLRTVQYFIFSPLYFPSYIILPVLSNPILGNPQVEIKGCDPPIKNSYLVHERVK